MPIAGENEESLIQYTDVIIRQTGDLRRIVDEFSQFARMPVPQRCLSDLIKIIDDVIHLETSRGSSIAKVLFEKPEPILLMIDPAMITQSLTNLIKNAGEAIETFVNKNDIDDYQPIINICVSNSELETIITISDNGIGLPKDRTRLFEPYMTTREKVTGLGLPIVKKIIEEHSGEFYLEDATIFENDNHKGTSAIIKLFKSELR